MVEQVVVPVTHRALPQSKALPRKSPLSSGNPLDKSTQEGLWEAQPPPDATPRYRREALPQRDQERQRFSRQERRVACRQRLDAEDLETVPKSVRADVLAWLRRGEQPGRVLVHGAASGAVVEVLIQEWDEHVGNGSWLPRLMVIPSRVDEIECACRPTIRPMGVP